MKGISEKTLIKIKDLKASVKLNNGDMLTTVTNANMGATRAQLCHCRKVRLRQNKPYIHYWLVKSEYEGEYFMMVYLFLL